MKIAIIGGAGFIGTNLYFFLKRKKLDVKILDNFIIKNNLKFIKKNDVIKVDITKSSSLKNKINNFDYIINLAGQTGVIESNERPNYCLTENIIGFSNILNFIKNSKKKIKLINASTGGAIYGDSKSICTENSEKRPISYYGLTKKFNEELSEVFFKLHKIHTVNLRFSNVYGEYSIHKKSFIHSGLKTIISGGKVKVFGDGSQTRDFIYVQDLVKLIFKSFKLKHGSYNFASGRSISINNILTIFKKLKSNINITYTKNNLTEVKDVKISNQKILKNLKINKKFFTSVDVGINKTLNWYKKFI